MANQIDGTKAPHHGLFYMENAGGHTSSQRRQHRVQQTSVSQAVSLGKRKKGRLEGRRRCEVGRQ